MVNCCIAQHLNNDDALWCAECGSLVTGAMIGDYRLICDIQDERITVMVLQLGHRKDVYED